jgi:putative tryptophan/tyrosine transport system substrate-binding protein
MSVLVTAATPASLAAKAATNTTPIVFVAVADPVTVGLVASLAHPGGNVTGLSLLTSDLSGKRLELLREIVLKISRVAILMNPDNESNTIFLKQTQLAARQLGIELDESNARRPEDADVITGTGRIAGVIAIENERLLDLSEAFQPTSATGEN